ncbi:MAG: glycosyltransferase family 2 protein [Maritimibacter sp.]|nr:glycosyltransferase family 2 protein [Maritimibacter sp.]
MSSKTLSVVIPVYNITQHADHLKAELAKLPANDTQIIVVDDGSTDGSVDVLVGLEKEMDNLTLIKSAKNAGAGVARNIGFPHATGKYTLFFDGDDDLHVDAINATIDRLESTKADVSINTYDFFRDGDSSNVQMNNGDVILWERYFEEFGGQPFSLSRAKPLVQFTNYPWNKIINTEHYRNLDISPLFGETRVNNDILGHWNILLHARKIVLVGEKIVTHHVSDAGNHISKVFGEGRLELFSALDALYDNLRSDPRLLAEFGHLYWGLVRTLVLWAQPRMRDDLDAEFRYRRRQLVSQISLGEMSLLEKTSDRGTLKWVVGSIA